DHALILNKAHARQLPGTYQRHYHNHRPHQARSQLPPNPEQQPPQPTTYTAIPSVSRAGGGARPTHRYGGVRRLRRPGPG
ncbi:MAG TPA: hypothetical protein VE196_02780, partial [Pseudonocardiaceae bacterium]|nr:hypothetical protein [Pseudonocardiaceae bacterium]